MFQEQTHQSDLKGDRETRENENGIPEPHILAGKKRSGETTRLQPRATSSKKRKDRSEVGTEGPEGGAGFREDWALPEGLETEPICASELPPSAAAGRCGLHDGGRGQMVHLTGAWPVCGELYLVAVPGDPLPPLGLILMTRPWTATQGGKTWGLFGKEECEHEFSQG